MGGSICITVIRLPAAEAKCFMPDEHGTMAESPALELSGGYCDVVAGIQAGEEEMTLCRKVVNSEEWDTRGAAGADLAAFVPPTK